MRDKAADLVSAAGDALLGPPRNEESAARSLHGKSSDLEPDGEAVRGMKAVEGRTAGIGCLSAGFLPVPC